MEAVEYCKDYFRQSTAHGLQYVADSKSKLDRLMWTCLFIASVVATFFYMYGHFDDNERNPFVTTMHTIPISEVPFPAVSVAARQAVSGNPWFTYARRILDNVQFDCFNEGQECINRTKVVRQNFEGSISSVMIKLFRRFLRYYDVDLTDKRTAQQLCLYISKMFGKDVYGVLIRLIKHIQDKTDIDMLASLAADTFRKPRSYFLDKTNKVLAEQSLGNNSKVVSFKDCVEALMNTSSETQALIHAFFVSQGSRDIPVKLGSTIFVDLMSSYSQNTMSNSLLKMNKIIIEDLLNKSSVNAKQPKPVIVGNVDVVFVDSPICKDLSNQEISNCSQSREKVAMECCHYVQKVTSSYEAFLSMMKLFVILPTWQVGENSHITDVESAIGKLPYEMESHEFSIQGQMPPIFHSRYYGEHENGYTLPACHFANTYGKSGIVYTFNGAHLYDMYKETGYMKAYFKQFYEKSMKCNGVLQKSPQRAISNGPHHGFEALISGFQGEKGKQVAVHSPYDIPDMSNSPLVVHAGKTYTITVTPHKMTSSDELDSMSTNKKKCFSGSSHNLTLFKEYGQSQCIFECQLLQAMRHCGCIPWNYPQLERDGEICFTSISKCFQEILSQTAESLGCWCPPACNIVHYTYSIDSTDTAIAGFCDKAWKRLGLAEDEWKQNRILNALDTTSPLDILNLDYPPGACRHLMKRMAFLRVYLAPPFVSVSSTSLRSTISDHVAAFGM